MSRRSRNEHWAKRAKRDKDAGRYNPPKTWFPGKRERIGSPVRNSYDNVNPRHKR